MSNSQANPNRTIVCIEDDPAMIELISLILKGKGFDLRGATSAQQGLDMISRDRPDLVLLDIMMPEMSGWDVYQRMKADPQMKDIPVIIVTARAATIDRVLGLNIAKVDDYITKPFSPSVLLGSISKVLGIEEDSPA
jgi:DNA-binding response OmpR family regulator